MNQTQDSDKRRRRAAALSQLEADLYRDLGRLHRARTYARHRDVQAGPPPAREPDAAEVIEGTFSVIGVESDDRYQPDIERIKVLRRAVYRPEGRIISTWALAIIYGYYGCYLLALDLLGLVVGLFYLKFFRAAKAPCPNCQEPFGSPRWWPTRLGGTTCQNCGFSIESLRRGGSS